MRALLDTSVFLRMALDPDSLRPEALEVIENEGVELLLSAASVWEIAIKVSVGKMALPEPPTRFVPERMASMYVDPLSVTSTHALAVVGLPIHHRDPFDRLLVGQARIEGIPVISEDAQLAAYDVELIWA